jgi:hypothetical protein
VLPARGVIATPTSTLPRSDSSLIRALLFAPYARVGIIHKALGKHL